MDTTYHLRGVSDHQYALAKAYLRTCDLDAVASEFRMTRDNARKLLKAAGITKDIRERIEEGAITVLEPEPLAGFFKLVVVDNASELPVEGLPAPAAEKPAKIDPVEKHRLTRRVNVLAAENKDLATRLAAAEDHRNSILGLPRDPVSPICLPRQSHSGNRGRQAAVLHLSDLHVGETVELAEMMGVNKYNREIAQRRIGRAFELVTILTTTAWPKQDDAPDVVYILLGGDLISGHGLHPELAETDYGTAYEQVKDCAKFISSGALRLSLELQEAYGKPVEIVFVSVVGNHGRSTPGKPRAKLAAIQSYDTLVADFIEAGLREFSNFKFYQAKAFDAYFDIVGWPTLLTHGDRMSAGGGTGFIGPAANIVKGHKKTMLTEAQQRRPVRFVFSGHFHTTLTTPWGFANGSGVGPSEFAKSIRADLEPAQQNYAVFHERHGLLRWHPLVLGRPDEGSIYQNTSSPILPATIE